MKKRKIREILIPKGISVTDMLETDDGDYADEPPALTEEVNLRFV